MDKTVYKKIIVNDYLGLKEEIKGSYPAEAAVKAEIKLSRWASRERRQRERDELDSLRELARYDTRQAENFFEESRNILKNNLDNSTKIDWASLYNDSPYPPFVFLEPAPKYKHIARELAVPEKNSLRELLFPSLKRSRLKLEKNAERVYADRLGQYNKRRELARAAYEKEREIFIKEQKEYNDSIDRLQLDFAKGNPEAVACLARIVLAKLICPNLIELEFDAEYEPEEKLLAVNAIFPPAYEIPRATRFTYNEEEHGITPLEMKRDDFEVFYKSILLQITLSSINAIFETINAMYIDSVGFNGWLKNGTEEEPERCVLTCKVSRDFFSSLDIAGTSPEKSFQALDGKIAEPLSGLTQVKPAADKKRMQPLYSKVEKFAPADAAAKKTAYRPGDIRHAARELMEEIIDQIEKDIIDLSETKKSDLH